MSRRNTNLNTACASAKRIIAGTSCLLLLSMAGVAAAAPDTILINGKVITVDDRFSIAQAVAISATRIEAVGDNDRMRAMAGPRTQIIDLGGRAVIPGLIDSHLHAIRATEHWSHEARFDGVLSRVEALGRVKAVLDRVQPDEWVYSLGGWFEEQFRDDPRGFSRAQLDALAPRNPVFLQAEYERAYVNTAYLDAMGFPVIADKAYIAQAKGLAADVVRDSQGVATGLLEGGFWMVSRAIQRFPQVKRADQDKGIPALTAHLNRLGLTSVFDPGGLGIRAQSYQRFREHASRGDLTVRVFHTLAPDVDMAGQDMVNLVVDALQTQEPFQGNDYFDCLALGEIYYRAFHFDSLTQTLTPKEADLQAARRILTTAAAEGWPVQTHAVHPSTMKNLFDLMEDINVVHPLRQLRWSITHADNIDAESLERARALGMNIQLRSTPVIGGMGEALEKHGDRLYDMPPLRLVQDSGVAFGLSTDGTKASQINPFATLWWAVTGKKLDGQVITRQTLTREEALIAHTRSNAFLLFQENRIGSIRPGLLADLVVLDRDYLTVPVEEIAAIKPVATMVGGAFVFNTALGVKTAQKPGITWPTADLVLRNGKVATVDVATDEGSAFAAAIAIREGRILFVGDDADVKRYIGRATQVVELRGKLATPGLRAAAPDDAATMSASVGEPKQQYRIAQQAGHKVGVTGWHDAGVDLKRIDIYKQMVDDGELKVRVHATLPARPADGAGQSADDSRRLRTINYGGRHLLQVRAGRSEAAHAALMEDQTGSLEVGKLADIVVWNRDTLSVDLKEIPAAQVLYTIVGGEIVYRRD